MKRLHRLLAAGCVALLTMAALVYAHRAGPDPRHTGAPGDDPLACTSSGCHVGVALNAGGGNVQIQFPDGLTYTPGKQQTVTVQVTDAAEKFFGFQMTARLASDPANGQAGDFTPGAGQQVLCDDGHEQPCLANAQVQFIEHTMPNNTGKWQVTWTPPATNVGDVYFFVAGNSATQTEIPDRSHAYTAHYTLSPAPGSGTKPTVSAAGVVSAQAFNAQAGVASGTWLEIFGSNISPAARGWAGPDFNGTQAPSTLNGVSVTINGKPAFVDFVNSQQVNVQVPDDPATGPVQLVVSNPDGQSTAVTVQKAAIAPALLAPAAWNVGGKQYVVAVFASSPGTFVGRTGLIGGVTFRPAKAGDIITMYGIGFGPVTPNVPAGTVAPAVNTLVTKPNFLFGQTAGDLACTGCFAGLAPGAVGLYQFNVKAPAAGTGDVALNVDVGGVSTKQTLFITLQ